MKKFYVVGVIVLLMMTGIVLLAQNGVDDQGNPNDPNLNLRANACYIGGSLEGTCTEVWKWECGWGIIRLEYGLLRREALSELCQSLLAPLPTPEPNNQKSSSNTNSTSLPSLPPLPTFTLPFGATSTPSNTPTVEPPTPSDTPTNTPTVEAPTSTDTPTSTPTLEPTETPTATP